MMQERNLMKWIPLAAVVFVIVGCSNTRDETKPLTLATTTSTRDSGLLKVLVPMFEKETGIEVKVVAVGSGQALELGRRGDADRIKREFGLADDSFRESSSDPTIND